MKKGKLDEIEDDGDDPSIEVQLYKLCLVHIKTI